MKRGKQKRGRSRGQPNAKHPHVTDRRIVLLNDSPLRKRAAGECNRAMAKLESARAQLQRFEQEDRPAFAGWMAATFGAMLTEIRENARLIHEQQGLMLDVETEMICGNHHNPRKAYAAVMKRREGGDRDDDFAPPDAAEDGAEDYDPSDHGSGEIPIEDRHALFEDYLSSELGLYPEEISEAEYAKMFAQFEAETFGDGPKAGTSQTPVREKPSDRGDAGRIKEIYRTLVRRLHPDLRADGDVTVSAIWHDVQEAYEARNLDRLETLLALTEIESGTDGGQASLSQIQRALGELNRALQVIQRSIQEAKRDPAWGFARNPYRGPLEKKVRRETEAILSEQRWVLAELKRTLDDWSRPWHPRPRKQGKPAKKPGDGEPRHESNTPKPVQTEFFAF